MVKFSKYLFDSHVPIIMFFVGMITSVILMIIMLIQLFTKYELNNFESEKLTKV